MAQYPFTIFKNAKPGAPGGTFVRGGAGASVSTQLGPVVGLAKYTTGSGRTQSVTGANQRRGVHSVQLYDILSGANQGRHAAVYTVNDPVGISDQFMTAVGAPEDATASALDGDANLDDNVDYPDLPVMEGATFVADGARRNVSLVGLTNQPGQPVPLAQYWGQNDLVQVLSMFLDDGGVQTVQTNGTGFPISLLPSSGGIVVNDAFYIGFSGPSSQFQATISPGSGTWVVTWEYWNGGSWVSIGAADNLLSFRFSAGVYQAGTGAETWDTPADWAASTEGPSGGVLAYWVRARVTTGDGAPTKTPTANNVIPVPHSLHLSGSVFPGGWHSTMGRTVFGGFAGQITNVVESIRFSVDVTLGGDNQDSVYFAHSSQFGGLRFDMFATGATGTHVWEYWDGSAWSALTILNDTANSLAQSGSVIWTVPGNWATLSKSGGVAAYPAPYFNPGSGGFTGYYVRVRFTAAATAGSTVGKLDPTNGNIIRNGLTFINAGALPGQRVTGSCIHIGDDPYNAIGSGGSSPGIIPWGIPLPPGIVADGGLYTFYDPVRNIHSRRMSMISGAIKETPDHPYPNVTHIAQWSGTDQNATLVATAPVNTVGATFTPAQATTPVVIGNDAGAPVTYDEALADDDVKRNQSLGFWRTASVHRRRLWLSGASTASANTQSAPRSLANRVIWSELDSPHHYQTASFVEIDPDDGDEIVALRSLGDTLLVLKSYSIHIITGNPQGQGSIGLQIRRVADIGCVAKRSAVVIHGRCFFLSQNGVYAIDRTGELTPVALSEPIEPLIRGLKQDFVHRSCAVYDPTEGLYLLAAPGLQRQIGGCSDTGTDINDGLFVYDIQRGQWSVWVGIYAASMSVMPKDESSSEIFIGDYWGGVYRLTDDVAEHPAIANKLYRGTVASATASTLVPNGVTADFIDSSTAFFGGGGDSRHVGLFIWITSGAGAGQVRRIVETFSPTPGMTIAGNWDTVPAAGDRWIIGVVPWWMETGDMDFGAPGDDKALRAVKTYLRNAMTLTDVIDYALSEGDSGDPTATYQFARETVERDTTTPGTVDLPPLANSIQRLRLQGAMHAARAVVRSIALELITTGSKRA